MRGRLSRAASRASRSCAATSAWTRDVSSLAGLAVDNRFLFVADDTGAVHALDKVTGASAWKQDKLAPRQPAGAQVAGDFLLVVDPEGYIYLLDRNDGKLVGRAPTDGTPATAQPARVGHQCGVAVAKAASSTPSTGR